MEKTAIKSGVPSKLAQMVSSAVADGSRRRLKDLSKLVNKGNNKVIAGAVRKVVDKVSIPQKRSLSGYRKAGSSSRRKLGSGKMGRKSRRAISYRIQNLIDSA